MAGAVRSKAFLVAYKALPGAQGGSVIRVKTLEAGTMRGLRGLGRATFRLSALVAVIASFGLVAATAASAGTTQVSGVQSAPVSASDPCFDTNAVASYAMEGSLVGCWQADTFEVRGEGQPSGTLQATGQEHFVGCVDLNGDHVCGDGDPQGTLTFTYTFTGKFDTVTSAEIHGRCHHVVVAGTGAFAGASGVISFHDDVATGTAPYRGHVTLT